VALALVRALGNPLVTTTATAGGEALVDPADINEQFPGIDMILDGGFGGAVASTVLDLTGPRPRLLRPGGVSVSRLAAMIGAIDEGPEILDEGPRASTTAGSTGDVASSTPPAAHSHS
jgi:tRNA A37 threonylcarbamoyladenosine synthetase subunit TsaC/SUA5/YrdC